MKVLAALSGGVDSAVAAARLVDAGHDVTAVHLALAPKPAAAREGARGCCTLEDARDARRVADRLGVPYYAWDLAERFASDVVEDFVAEYGAGRTPNPCVRCNERVKFAAVLERGRRLGFDAVCTGHYARVEAGLLHRGADPAKDQSYVLASLTAEQLAHAVLPLGDSLKADVRREAAGRGLAVADKPDSHDVCFIPDGDTAGFLRRALGARPGPVVDARSGAVVGAHEGAHAFTVGQRRGLALDRPAPDGRPRYVLDVTPVDGVVRVGPVEALDTTVVRAAGAVWSARRPERGERVEVQLRAHGAPVGGTVDLALDGDGLAVALERPVRAVAPGQLLAVYSGALVLGAARVVAAGRPGAAGGGSGPAG